VNGKAVFWDAGALVPLMIKEERSSEAQLAWRSASGHHAWEWALVEVDAALIRRQAGPDIWQEWQQIQKRLCLYSVPGGDLRALRTMNRGIGLRAADAGHLFLFHTLWQSIPELKLITFDQEMALAAKRLGLRIHEASAFK